MKKKIMIIIGAILVLGLGFLIFGSKQETTQTALTTQTLETGTENSLVSNINGFTKEYDPSKENVIVRDSLGNVVRNMSLVTPKVNVINVGGENTLVGVVYLDTYKDNLSSFWDKIDLYDMNERGKTTTKNIRTAYRTDTTEKECSITGECANVVRTTWTDFNKLSELPKGKIEIGLFTDTKLGEHIEWVMETSDFNITEWAEWVVNTSVWDGATTNFSVAGQETSPYDIHFSTNGSKMFLIGNGDNVYQYSLGTSWVVNSTSWDGAGKTFSFTHQDTIGFALAFNGTGTKMYIGGIVTGRIYEYTLSTAWDMATASWDGPTTNLSLSGQDSQPVGIAFSPNGTKMYVAGTQNDNVYQYSLGTAWDTSTATWDGPATNVSIGSLDVFPQDLYFDSTGTRMYVLGGQHDSIYQFTLGTAWSLASATWNGASSNLSVTNQDTNPEGMFFNATGTRLIIMGDSNDRVYQYSLAEAGGGGGDTAFPTITLSTPPDAYTSTATQNTFNATVYDDTAVSFVRLYGNFSGSWALNSTNTSGINNSQYKFTIGIADGFYKWGYWANDTGNNVTVSANRTLTVNTTSPPATPNNQMTLRQDSVIILKQDGGIYLLN